MRPGRGGASVTNSTGWARQVASARHTGPARIGNPQQVSRLAGPLSGSTHRGVFQYSRGTMPLCRSKSFEQFEFSPEGSRGSDMDSAMARANRAGDDSEITDGL